MSRKRWLLTGKERWTENVVESDVKESRVNGQVYAKRTKTVVESVREVELECGHWSQYRYDGGKKSTSFCAACAEAEDS